MMNGFVGMLLANENTNKAVTGLGALKGAPCVIESTEPFEENGKTGTIITFKWTDENGNSETLPIKVFNGTDGEAGEGNCDCEEIKDITEAELNDICKI